MIIVKVGIIHVLRRAEFHGRQTQALRLSGHKLGPREQHVHRGHRLEVYLSAAMGKLGLPLSQLRNLQVYWKKKLGAALMFGVGFL